MSKRKYTKKADGSIRGVNTPTLNLEKPLGNENYDINIFNSNMDKVDTAVKNVNTKVENIELKVEGLELTAEKVTISDSAGNFTAENVEGALAENALKITELSKEVNGQRLEAINIHNLLDRCF